MKNQDNYRSLQCSRDSRAPGFSILEYKGKIVLMTVPRLGRHFGRIVGSPGRRGDLKEVTKLAEQKATTSVLYEETRIFEPSKELVENSNVMAWMKKKGFKSEREMRAWTGQNYIQFWDEMAKTYADWFEPYAQVLNWVPPYAKWFVGGKMQCGL